MISSDKGQPLYHQIYSYLLDEIRQGNLVAGDRVPSEKELSTQFHVSRITSKRALEMLSNDGKIVRVPGKGSFLPLERVKSEAKSVQEAGFIGCVMADFDDSFGVRLLQGLEKHAAELGYQLVLHLSRDVGAEEQAIAKLLDARARGVIIMPCHGEHYNSAILKLVLERFPLVFIDRNLRGLAASSVSTDNVKAAQMGTNHLIELGHRAICFVSSPPIHTSTIEERLEGFVKSHAEHGVAIDEELRLEVLTTVRPPHYWTIDQVGDDVQKVCDHLAAHPEITAVFAAEFAIARIVETAVRRLGRKIPDEISVVCFDNPMRYDLEPHFTHLRQQEYEIGSRAAQIIHDQITGSRKIEKVRLGASLVPGITTAARSTQSARRR